ncbi:MAG: outer membrane protein assembly factor BamD [Alphaproteobacteria bacterium]|nr:outer membrane protein assembly factor BamD [Alphaproteobacteria bacterium]
MLTLTLLCVLGLAFAGCSGGDEEVYVERPVEDLYNEAMDLLLAESYDAAAAAFEEVERQHPYSVWATKAQLMSAFAHYQSTNYDETVLAAERFIELHPGSSDAPYARYLVGLSFYEQISDVGRDQRNTELALEAFEDVVLRYPDTRYARDAALKISLARDHLAGKEMKVGRTYQSLEFYLAAINRFRNVISEYETTSHAPEALLRLTECYLALGVVGEAQAAAAVLGYNFPGSQWYRDAYVLLQEEELEPRLNESSWLARIF